MLSTKPPLAYRSRSQYLRDAGESLVDELLRIQPIFDYPEEAASGFHYYLKSAETLVKRVIPEDILAYGHTIGSLQDQEKIQSFYEQIGDTIPCLSWTISQTSTPCTLSVIFLCPSDYTQGVGRFISDMCSRWIIPGKQLQLVYVHSIAFRFQSNPRDRFFIQEVFARVENPKDISIVLTHLPPLAKEFKLNVLAVQHARKVIAARTLTLDQKKLIIQENIAALLEKPLRDCDGNLYDQMHHFFIKVLAENKLTQIKEQIAPLLEFRPQIFERDIFSELQQFVFAFKDKFSAVRDLKHLTRIISYSYLFRKTTSQAILSHPNQRHVSIKVFRTHLQGEEQTKKVVGILLAINLLCDNEIFEERHMLKAVQSLLPQAQKVADSTIIDKRSNSSVRTVYLEITKKEGSFSATEVNLLRDKLSREIKTSVESVINPIFMPRNEEEIMKNILTLNNQLKYLQDLPQVIISFHKQTDDKISFTVVLVRVVKPDSLSTQKLFAKNRAEMQVTDLEVKNIGLLRKKYPKEAVVFEIEVEKKRFLRSDFSVDLYEARKSVFHTLSKVFGEVRDYNGGMISKQNEVLSELKRMLLQTNIQNDFLVENFFYSLSPKYMQSIITPRALKKLFLLVLEATEHDYQKQVFFLKTQIFDSYFLLTIGATNPTIKDFIDTKIEELQINPSSLTSSYLNIYDISCLSYILKFDDSQEHERFLQHIIRHIKVWKSTVEHNLPANNLPSIVLDKPSPPKTHD